jgi:hypothetical protein
MDHLVEGIVLAAVATALAYLSVKAARSAAAALGVSPTLVSSVASLAAHGIA